MTEAEWGRMWLGRWNKVCRPAGLKASRVYGGERVRRLKEARALEPDLDVWEAAFRVLARDPFYAGVNNRKWRAGPDYALRPMHIAKVLDAGYEEQERAETERADAEASLALAQTAAAQAIEARAARRVIE